MAWRVANWDGAQILRDVDGAVVDKLLEAKARGGLAVRCGGWMVWCSALMATIRLS